MDSVVEDSAVEDLVVAHLAVVEVVEEVVDKLCKVKFLV